MNKTDLDFDMTPKNTHGYKDSKSYLLNRGIKEEIIDTFTIGGLYRFNGSMSPAVGFTYKHNNAIKWRSIDGNKYFSQQNTCEDFFLLDTHVPGNSILICEGEIDALAWLSAGLPENVTVVSVPNGAPARVSEGKPEPSEDGRFKYIWRAKEQLATAPRIYLNTDNDEPGRALAEEISRRVGRSKIWHISLDTKDAAEAIKKQGISYLLQQFHAAEPSPVVGLHIAEDFSEDFTSLYEHGQMRGAQTGIDGLDKLMCVPLGMMTVVTGFPGSGKSDMIDQICFNLAKNYGWKTVYCSFEKPVPYHMAQLAQKLIGKPFFGVERMSQDEAYMAEEWINEHFMFMDSSKGGPTDIDGILDAASAAVMRMGCRVLVIDPYNYIETSRDRSETDSISYMLTKIRMWAKRHDAHVFFVAHPTKVSERGKYICTGLDVSGSAAWFAKTDIGLTAWRHFRDAEPPEAHVWKIRWGWMGKLGSCKLTHDPQVGTWRDADYVPDDFDWDFE